MKSSLIILLLAGLLALVASFTKEDHEIFRLRDEIETTEGSDVTFYDFLGVQASASQEDIIKALRTKSRKIHPDKAKQSFVASKARATSKPIFGQKKKKPGVTVNKAPSEGEIQAVVKKANERYARLGVIAQILKGPGRERYDHFLSNGFPKWRGTGYYYARFRPGLGTVLVGLFAFGGGLAHYGAMYVSWKRQRGFIDGYIRNARQSAWGDESGIRGIPGLDGAVTGATAAAPSNFAQDNGAAVLNRRQKRMQERENKKEAKKPKINRQTGTSTPLESEPEPVSQGTKKKVTAPNGKTLVVDSAGNVYIEEEDEDGGKGEYLLDPDVIPKPTFRDTALFRLPVWIFSTFKSRISHTQANHEQAELQDPEIFNAEGNGEPMAEEKPSVNGSARKRGKRNGKAS